MKVKKETVFETETCSRCAGSGNYSYCQMYGTTCFKCGGSGIVLTERGAAAIRWLIAKRTIPASSVKPGMRIKAMGMTLNVQSTALDAESTAKSLVAGEWVPAPPYLHIQGQKYAVSVFEDTPVTVIPPKAEARIQVAEAIAYQATLTKAGTAMKRSKVA